MKSCFWSHDWGKWEIYSEGNIVVESPKFNVKIEDNRVIGRFIYQQRKCQRCNFVEIDSQEQV